MLFGCSMCFASPVVAPGGSGVLATYLCSLFADKLSDVLVFSDSSKVHVSWFIKMGT